MTDFRDKPGSGGAPGGIPAALASDATDVSQTMDLSTFQREMDDAPRYRLLEKLPKKVRYLRSLRALDQDLGRPVELRLLRRGTPEPLQRLFHRERKALLALDHPAFLPVLDEADLEGLPCYVVPLRRSPDLLQLVPGGTLPLAERCLIVRQLASAVAAVHRRGKLLGLVRPEMICWDRGTATLHYAHHVCRDPEWPVPGALRAFLGEELVSRRQPCSDLFLWGVQAYWVLTGGASPFQPTGEPAPNLRSRVRELHPDLCFLVQACLSRTQADRPANGLELQQLLLAYSRDLADPVAEPGSPPEEGSDLFQTLSEIRRSGQLEPLPEVKPLAESERLPEVPIAELMGDDTQGVVLSPRTLGVLALLLATVVLGALYQTFFAEKPVRAPVTAYQEVVVPEGEVPKARPDWKIQPLPASTQATFQEDRLVRKLLRRRPATAETFPGYWSNIRKLCLRRRLPKPLDGWGRIMEMKETFGKENSKGVEALEAFRTDLRTIVGIPREWQEAETGSASTGAAAPEAP